MPTATVSALVATWLPANWVDWLVIAFLASGLVAGARRGLVLAVGSLAAAVAAFAFAVHFGPQLAAAADARWHATQQVSAFLQRYMPLPDGSGQIPYSPSALAVFLRQATAQGTLAPGYAAALAAASGAVPPTPAHLTIGGYVEGLLASRIVAFAAFTAVLLAAEAVLLLVVRVLLGGVARDGWAWLANTLLGAVFGALERLVEATAVLAMFASLSVLPALGGLAGALAQSHWAPKLLTTLRAALPGADSVVRSWLLWL